jgi:pathogenesis-related protein 1
MVRACIRLIAALWLVLMAGCASRPEQPAAVPGSPGSKPMAKTGSVSKMSARDVQAITAYHDKVRADVGVGPMKWSRTLAVYAQEWSDHLAATTCRMAHRTEGKYGENLFQGTAGFYTAVDAAKNWEAEKKDYRGGVLTESDWRPAGHYTQMVWRDTTALGCGEAVCKRTLIVVCNYDPPGNYIGRRPY